MLDKTLKDYKAISDKLKFVNAYEKTGRKALLEQNVPTFGTCFATNIKTHAVSHVKRWLKKKYENDWKEKLSLCVDPQKSWSDLEFFKCLPRIARLRVGDEPLPKFAELEEKWYKFVPFFQDLQQDLTNLGCRSFVLSPVYSIGRKHIMYNTTAIHQMLTCETNKKAFPGVRVQKKWEEATDSMDKTIALWKNLLNDRALRVKGKRWAYFFSTNGVDCSLHYLRPVKSSSSPGVTQYAKKYDRLVGLDPGMRCTFGGVICTSSNNDKYVEKNYLLRGATFNWRRGYYSRKRRQDKLAEELLRANPEVVNCSDPCQRDEVLRHRLRHFTEGFTKATRRSYTRMKFDEYIRTNREIDKTISFILFGTADKNARPKNVFVALGDTNNTNRGPMRGHVRSPLKRFERRMRLRAAEEQRHGKCRIDIVTTDEFRTTKLCSRCCGVQKVVSENRARYAVCPHCRVTWNRDVNGGRNILQLALIRSSICNSSDLSAYNNYSRSTKANDLKAGAPNGNKAGKDSFARTV